MNSIKRKITFENILAFLLVSCAFCQLIITFYFNCFKAVSHMTIDASWEYLKVRVIGDNGGFFPTELLHETTQPLVERIFLLVAPLYRLFGDIYVAYAISNLLITLLSVYVLYLIAVRFDFKLWQTFIVINLFLSPFLANGFDINNDLGYFVCVNGFGAYQNMSELCFLLIVYVLTFEIIDKKRIVVAVFACFFTVYLCLCKGMGMLTWFGAPLLIYVLVRAWISDTPKEFVSWKSIFSYAIIISMVIGRALGGFMGLSYFDNAYYWTTASNFFDNLKKMLEGFMLLVGAIPATGKLRGAFSFDAIPFLFGRIIFYVLVISLAWTVKELILNASKKEEIGYQTKLLLVVVVISTIFEYSVIDTRLSGDGDTFCARYLITALLCMFILVAFFLNELKPCLFKTSGIIMLFISIVAMDLFSDYYITCANTGAIGINEIFEVVENKNPDLVVFWSDYQEMTHAEKILRVTDSNRVYKNVIEQNKIDIFGDYAAGDNLTEFAGSTMIVTATDNPGAPEEVLQNYELVSEFDGISIYYSDENHIELMQ